MTDTPPVDAQPDDDENDSDAPDPRIHTDEFREKVAALRRPLTPPVDPKDAQPVELREGQKPHGHALITHTHGGATHEHTKLAVNRDGLTRQELLDLFDRTAMYPGIRAAILAVLKPDTPPVDAQPVEPLTTEDPFRKHTRETQEAPPPDLLTAANAVVQWAQYSEKKATASVPAGFMRTLEAATLDAARSGDGLLGAVAEVATEWVAAHDALTLGVGANDEVLLERYSAACDELLAVVSQNLAALHATAEAHE